MAPAELEFDVVDVFASAPYSGNQLAVVHGAAGLPDHQLLAIAREFNYSETTFPTPVDEATYAVRIFTPAGELPFAGHPTLGTAWVLRDRGLIAADRVVQRCGAGDIAVAFAAGLVELTAPPRELVGPLPVAVVEPLLADLGLGPEDLAGDVWIAGAGLSFLHLPVVADAVGRARAGLPLTSYAALPHTEDPLEGVNVFALGARADETHEGLAVRSRVFVPLLSVPEDPATGSAAAGLGVALVAAGVLPEGGRYEITQGVELGRPSRLSCRVSAERGRAVSCRVAGQVHPVARGRLRTPAV